MRIILCLVISLGIAGCKSLVVDEQSIVDIATGRYVDIYGLVPNNSDLVDVLANADLFLSSDCIYGFQEEAQIKAFVDLYHQEDPDLFVRVFEKSRGFSGKLYAMLALWDMDQKMYLSLRKQIKDELYLGYVTDSPTIMPQTTDEVLRKVESGELTRSSALLLDNQYSLRHMRFLSYLSYLETYPQKLPTKRVCERDPLSTSKQVILGSEVGYSLEWDVIRLNYSTLFDESDPQRFIEIFEESDSSAGRVYALVGLHFLNYKNLKKYSDQMDGCDVPVQLFSDTVYKGEEQALDVLNQFKCGAYSHKLIYIDKKDRSQYKQYWL